MIVDASVAMKWITPEPDTERALGLIGTEPLSAPDLIFCEIANGVWKKVWRGELRGVPANLAFVASVLDAVESAATLLARAVALSVELTHPAYDCFYLAMAERQGERLVTADRRFRSACAQTPHERHLLWFGDEA